MPKQINYTLTTESLAEIEQAIRNHEDLRVRQRATIVRLLHLGETPQEIAELLSIKTGRVYYWHKRWREERIDGLADKVRTGRPKAADAAYRRLMLETIETEPSELGYAFTVWSGTRLLAHLEKTTGVRISLPTLLSTLAEEGYVYRRPKHTLDPLQDKEAKARAEETIDLLKKSVKQKKSNFSLWTKQP